VALKRVITVDRDATLARVNDAMLAGDVVLVRAGTGDDPERLVGIVTKIDLIDFYARAEGRAQAPQA
ncbi:MAG TPA: CBS domain-containing protein, partial [Myxococcota bacterium]|nr:CBS domain-containing protein [Myxococcota bacterium]